MIEDNKIISDDPEVAQTLIDFFDNAISTLEIKEPIEHIIHVNENSDPMDAILRKYSNHPSILNILRVVGKSSFSFHEICLADIVLEINQLDVTRSNPRNAISAKQPKDYIDICGIVLHETINYGIRNSVFDDSMKLADLTPVHKKDEAVNKCNYRPISGLPSGSKIFERIIQGQIGNFVDKLLSPYLCGYRKGYSVHHALITLVEKWRISLDNNRFGGAILVDLSKAFDTINHNLLIAKLQAYGFSVKALKLIKSYLSNRWQRTKVNNSFSS